MYFPVHGTIERIHGEVAPPCIRFPVIGEGDARFAAKGFDIDAQRRHFERLAANDQSDGAVVDTGRMHTKACFLSGTDDALGRQRRRDVDLAHRLAKEGIAYRTTSDTTGTIWKPVTRVR